MLESIAIISSVVIGLLATYYGLRVSKAERAVAITINTLRLIRDKNEQVIELLETVREAIKDDRVTEAEVKQIIDKALTILKGTRDD